VAKLRLDQSELPRINDEFEVITEGQELTLFASMLCSAPGNHR
jgi:hypothetical protein